MGSNVVIELEEVGVSFGGIRALDEVSLKITAGERVAIVGPSGGGKTTALRVMGAQVRPTVGVVKVFGKEVWDLKEEELRRLRSQVGFIPQDLGLVPNLRVIQNVMSGRVGRRSLLGVAKDLLWPARKEREEVLRWLERVGIGDRLYDRTDRLSGGQQQRVAVARLLYQGAEVILADEPVSAVDPARARDLVKLLAELGVEREEALVMSIHQIDLAREYFERLIGLRDGQVFFDKKREDVSDEMVQDLYRLELGDVG